MRNNIIKSVILLGVLALVINSPVQALTLTREGRVTVLSLPGSELQYIILTFNTGTVRDPAGKEGLNQMTARLIEESIRKKIDEQAPQSAARLSTRIDKEITTFYLKVHRDMFGKAYPLFISGILHPSIDADSLDLARESAEAEREGVLRHGETLSLTALELFVFRNHPYGTPDFGTKKSQAAIGEKDVRDFFARYYTRDNYTLGVGGFDAEKVSEMVKSDLDSLPAGAPPALLPGAPPAFRGNRIMLIKTANLTTSVALGFPIDVTRSDPDYYSLLPANAYFGEHRYLHGLLFRQLRVKRGFNYGDYSYVEEFAEAGQDKMPSPGIPRHSQYFYIWIRNIADENAWFATKFALYSLRQMVSQGLSEESFGLMKDFLTYNTRLWDYDPFQVLGFSMDSDFYHTPYFITYIGDWMKKISKSDVSNALKKHLSPEGVKIVVVTGKPDLLSGQIMGEKDCHPVYKTTLGKQDQEADEKVIQYDIGERKIEAVDGESMF